MDDDEEYDTGHGADEEDDTTQGADGEAGDGVGDGAGEADPVMAHLVRRRVYERVVRDPGIHYTALKEGLALSDGVLDHHLHVLEKEGRLVSRRERNRRCFYLTARGHPPRDLDQLSELQAGILVEVQLDQGVAQGDLARRLGVSKQDLNYHLRDLCARKLVYRRKEGRHTRFYVDPGRLADELL
jgi:predicted transcriptional regulator